VTGVTTYTVIKFFHVLLAIVAVGFNATYGIWLARTAREPEHTEHVLRGIKILDDRFANPAYGLLLVTGLLMVWVGDLDLTTFWLATSLGIYAFVVVLGFAGYTPTLRRQIAALEAHGAASAEYRRLAARGTVIGLVLAISVVGIVFLMVTKPTL
jgi:uncharacterized membrane protein